MDLSKLLQLNPGHETGQRRINLYQRKKEEMKQNEKKLVKAVCGYIQQATNAVSTIAPVEDPVDSAESTKNRLAATAEHTKQGPFLIALLITVVFAWILQKYL